MKLQDIIEELLELARYADEHHQKWKHLSIKRPRIKRKRRNKMFACFYCGWRGDQDKVNFYVEDDNVGKPEYRGYCPKCGFRAAREKEKE